jgi:hypothetical protein
MIKEDILNAIKANNQFDGTYYELYLEKPFFMNAEEEVIRVMADNENDGDIIVHVMNQSDESRFVPFDMLDNERQINVYAEVCKSYVRKTNLDDFFDRLKGLLDDGDKLYVKYDVDENGEDDYDNMVYSIYNSCDNVIGEYYTKYGVYKRY